MFLVPLYELSYFHPNRDQLSSRSIKSIKGEEQKSEIVATVSRVVSKH